MWQSVGLSGATGLRYFCGVYVLRNPWATVINRALMPDAVIFLVLPKATVIG